MSKYMMVAFTNPVAGRDDDYNEWYNNTHMKDVTGVPGIRNAQRFKVQMPMLGEFSHRYVCFYDLDAETSEEVGATLQALGTTKMEISDALDGAGSLMGVFEAFEPQTNSKDGEALGTFRMLVIAKPQAGREGEYDDWYVSQHLPDLVSTPGVATGQRFKLQTPLMNEFQTTRLALYGLEATTVEGVGEMLKAMAAANHSRPADEPWEQDKTRAGIFEACSAKVTAPKDKAPA